MAQLHQQDGACNAASWLMTVIMVHKHDRHDHGAAWLLAQKAFYILTLLYIHYHDNKKKGMKQEQGEARKSSHLLIQSMSFHAIV